MSVVSSGNGMLEFRLMLFRNIIRPEVEAGVGAALRNSKAEVISNAIRPHRRAAYLFATCHPHAGTRRRSRAHTKSTAEPCKDISTTVPDSTKLETSSSYFDNNTYSAR